jgi:enolase-phosphatase E1
MIRVKRPKAIILDIEGTTTSANYYPSAVAPYIRNNIENYLKAHWNEEHVQSIVRDLRVQAAQNPEMPKILDKSQGATLYDIQKSCLNHIEFLFRNNITTIALLYFQMYIWLDGQMKGILKTHIFPDVAEMMYKWKFEEHIAIYIYSSARADVQMLMFACTEYGSLLHLIDGHFDSKIGTKTANETYSRIAQAIQLPANSLVFLTDDAKEARSAKNCGCKVLLVKRERKTFSPIEVAQFDIVSSFDRIKFVD